jgi:hypothetical protein
MPSSCPAGFLGGAKVIEEITERAMNAALAVTKDSVFVSWPGVVPWTVEGGGDPLPGIVAAFRRTGKPYEYERGEVKVRGYDIFLIARTKDILAGKLRAQTIVTVQSRANPDEPPVKYMVRMVDEMGDTNAHVYLLELNEDGTAVAEPDAQDDGADSGRRHGPRPGRGMSRW